MATRLVLPRNLHRVLSNFTIPDIATVNNAMTQVLNTLFAQYCKRVDPAGDCIVAPAFPATDFKVGGKYVGEVLANAYIADDFTVNLNPPKTDLLATTIKENVVIPIVGFYIESPLYPLPVARINIYRYAGKGDLWKSVTTTLSNTINVGSRGAVVMLPEPLIVGPGGEIAIEAVIESSYTPETSRGIRAVVAWLPPVVFTSRSLFLTPSTTGQPSAQ
jgi:hypothetical protein